MNKILSISVLGITVAALIFIGVGIISNEPKYDLIYIQGSKNNLEDVVFTQSQNIGLYKNIQSVVSKDGFEVEKYKNDKDFKNEYIKIISSNKDLFNGSNPLGNGIYKSDENIGYVETFSQTYNEKGELVQEFIIRNKNIKTNKINEWNFTLPEKIKEDSDVNQDFAVGIKGNEVYILRSVVEGIEYNRKGDVNDIGDSFLNIYAFNLDTQEVKKKENYEPHVKEGYKAVLSGSVGFNKMYTLIQQVNLKDKEKLDYYLVYYDIATNKFNTIKEPVIKDSQSPLLGGDITIKVDLEGDTLYLLQHNKGEEKNINVELSKVDLKNDKILYVDKAYATGNTDANYDVSDLRVLNNKIYMCITSWKETNTKYIRNEKMKDSIVVLDENTGQILYKGEYIDDNASYAVNQIIKKEEL